MERNQAAKLMLDAMLVLETFAKVIEPETDHISCYAIEGATNVSIFRGDDEIMDAHLFDDGTIRINGDYFEKGEL